MVININEIDELDVCVITPLATDEQLDRIAAVFSQRDIVEHLSEKGLSAVLAYLRFVPDANNDTPQHLADGFWDSYRTSATTWREACAYALELDRPDDDEPPQDTPVWIDHIVPEIMELAHEWLVDNYWIVRDRDEYFVFAKSD